MAVKVKICGITNLPDALAAAAQGADALGFVFFEKSSRHVSLEKAASIIRELPPHILKVGVFVDPLESTVLDAVAACGLNLLQFHGNETPEFCLGFGVLSMKAFRVRDAESLRDLANYPTHAWLLDAFSSSGLGGTGESFNWDLAVQANALGRPIFLAGGLTPENVSQAVRRVRPFGVDVSSGVELAPGKKDHDKIRAFIQAAKAATGQE
jgi:phosphoribosylanthranilate isomerase